MDGSGKVNYYLLYRILKIYWFFLRYTNGCINIISWTKYNGILVYKLEYGF